MEELRQHTNLVLFESYRTMKMKQTGGVTGLVTAAGDQNTLARLEQTKVAHDQKMGKMEAEMRAVFQQKVAEKEAKLKQSETEVAYLTLLYLLFLRNIHANQIEKQLYARHKEMKEQLEKQRAELEERLRRLDSSRPGTPSESGGKSWRKTSLFK
jgi:septin 7